MKCILLCAGYATRLYPLTENFPKPLLEIGNKELLTHIIEKVNEIDIVDEIIIITNNKFYDVFNNYALKQNNKRITVLNDQTNSNDDRLGVIGDIKYAIDSLNINDEVMLIAGDNIFDYSLVPLIDYYKSVNTNIVVCKQIEDTSLLKRFGVVTLDKEKVISFVEKPNTPESDIATYATYIFTKDVINYVKERETTFFSKDKPLIEYIYKDFGLNAYVVKEECYDIGTHESLAEVRKIYQK